MSLTTKQQAICALILVAVSFATGRWLAPQKLSVTHAETKANTNSTDQKVDQNTDTHKEVVVTETTKPDGTKQVVTDTINDVRVDKSTDTSKVNSVTTAKTDSFAETKSKSRLNLGLLVGTQITKPDGLVYGGYVNRDMIGPIQMGLFGFTDGRAGVSIGLTF